MEYGLIVSIISAALGGGSTILGLVPYLKVGSKYASLRKALSSIEATPSSSRVFQRRIDAAKEMTKEHWDHIIEWLDYGEIIIGPLMRRISTRVVILTSLYLSTAALVGVDFKGAVLPGHFKSIEVLDLFAILGLFFGPYLALMERYLLTDTEKLFLRNLNDLHCAFYEHIVRPALDDFNLEFESFFKDYRKSRQQELDYIKYRLKKLKKDIDRLRSKLPDWE